VEAAGIELPPQNTEKTQLEAQGGAESGAVGAREAPLDPDLQLIVDRWEDLPQPIKAGILAMVRAAE